MLQRTVLQRVRYEFLLPLTLVDWAFDVRVGVTYTRLRFTQHLVLLVLGQLLLLLLILGFELQLLRFEAEVVHLLVLLLN